MDIKSNIAQYFPLIIVALAIIAIQYLLRRGRGRDPVKNQLEIVQDLNAEVRLDLRMAEVLKVHPKPMPFVTTTWQINKRRLDFLSETLQKNIAAAFTLAEDYNTKIIAATKSKSLGDLATLDVGKLTRLLRDCQDGLEQWMLLKVGSKNPPVKGPGIIDSLLGKR